MKVGLDVFGGDFAPRSTVEGALLFKETHPDCELVLFGPTPAIQSIAKEKDFTQPLTIVHTEDKIQMGAHPTKAFVRSPNSSIALGFGQLKSGEIDAFASAGNTGAMLVGSMYTIKSIEGVIRPCITSVLPKENGGVNIILDVGINSDCKPDVLDQFAVLGSIFADKIYGIKSPKVGLLNIGEEEGKGNLLSQAAHRIMKDNDDFNFVGNIEGSDIFENKADVIVCDGFTGNVVLKEAEAFYKLIRKRKLTDDYFSRFNYEIYGGTPVLGVNGNVIIGHGMSSPEAIKNMLILATETAKAGLSNQIRKAFSEE